MDRGKCRDPGNEGNKSATHCLYFSTPKTLALAFLFFCGNLVPFLGKLVVSGASRAHWNESTIVIKHQEYNNSGAKGNSFFINDICPVLLQETKQGTFAPHKSMRFRGCVSRVFNFTYLRVVGKTAGTFVQKTYLIPQLCKLLESSGTVRLSKQKTKLFGGSVVPKDCERQLLKLGWLDCRIQGNLT